MLVLHLAGRLGTDITSSCAIRKLDHDDHDQAKQDALAWARDICAEFAKAHPAASRRRACKVAWGEPQIQQDVLFLQTLDPDSGWTIIQHPDGDLWAWNDDDEEFEIDIR